MVQERIENELLFKGIFHMVLMKEESSFAASGRISPKTKTEMKYKRLDAFEQQADIQQLCQVTCLPTAAVPQQAQELQCFRL